MGNGILAPNFQAEFSCGKSKRTIELFIRIDVFFHAQTNGVNGKKKNIKF